jgi:polar amino acid transport system substrate-binding protein
VQTRPERSRVGWGGILLLLGLVAVVVAILLLRDDGPKGDTLARARAGEVLRIGYANEAPYGYLDTDTGRVTGEAPEIARVMLERMGIAHVEPVVARFGELIPGLQAGQIDIVAAGMYVTPERCKEIAFSEPTYRIGEAFIVRSGNPLDLHGYDDVAQSDAARIGVMGGAVEHGYAKKLGIPGGRIVVFEDYATALAGLEAERIDALAATTLTVGDLLGKANNPAFARAEPFHQPIIDGKTVLGYGAFGFRKEDEALLREFNRHLEAFLGTPEHLGLVRPFGFSETTLPGDVTTADLCAGSD